MLLSTLKAATSEQHRRVEAALDPTRPDLTHDQYIVMLRKFYGFLRPWEELIRGRLSAAPRKQFDARRKTPWLEEDLAKLDDHVAAAVPQCRDLPRIDDEAAAIGSWYVIEGSTLGGQVITKHLNGRWGLSPQAGLRYFSGYGEATRTNWTSFRELAEAAVKPADYHHAAAAAGATFDSLRDWFAH